MITTFYGDDALSSSAAFGVSLLIGFGFGAALEQAGFGSSKKLAGIFYFRDMTVLKVMFTALLTAMLGLQFAVSAGIVAAGQIYYLPTVYGAQIVGGLVFGIGFAVGCWCPGTAAVGAASGRLDAVIFLAGAVIGSIIFNEAYLAIVPLYEWGEAGVRFAWAALGMSANIFALLFSGIAVAAFWGAELIERRTAGTGIFLGTPFLKTFSLAILVAASAQAVLPTAKPLVAAAAAAAPAEKDLLAGMAAGEDHIEPEEVAERLMHGDRSLYLVDIRSTQEFSAFHLPGALNASPVDLPESLAHLKNTETTIVLYSNGMVHPAQSRDALARMGFVNVYLLTDGLDGFINRVLKPASLRNAPLSLEEADRIKARRNFFLARVGRQEAAKDNRAYMAMPRLVDTQWLADNLSRSDIRVMELRPQPSYNGGHIPGAVRIDVEHFRGTVDGVPSMLLPGDMIARHLQLLGIAKDTTVVIAYGDKVHDATLLTMALMRAGHERYMILDGGWEKWAAENRLTETALPRIMPANSLHQAKEDAIAVDYQTVLRQVQQNSAVLLDVRPTEAFSGKITEEARGGHIPGAVNRPLSEDLGPKAGPAFKPVVELEAQYSRLIPSKNTQVIVMCRTGHQASQTFFVLKEVLGYRNVKWYDGGWTEWASRPELPIQRGPG